jgi:hypothetical protein
VTPWPAAALTWIGNDTNQTASPWTASTIRIATSVGLPFSFESIAA